MRTVTGTITATCGCRIRYDDTNETHRRIRLAGGRSVKCEEHGWEMVEVAAYTGPPELLWPDPEVRREVEEDIRRDHQEEPY